MRQSFIAQWVALLTALFATFFVLALIPLGGSQTAQTGSAVAKNTTVPPPLPDIAPVELEQLDPATAREKNAAVPFVKGAVTPSSPFRFVGTLIDRQRAIDCLAAAQLYEAGNDSDGQRAVAQVVLNRVRHPAFPNTVCGVVFQGSERTTGCQFTFTCDGSLARRYSADAWARAQSIADLMISGAVDPRVGLATHYHTDWVLPYWSPTLDKVAQVGTHLFFRWPGYWGTPRAFARSNNGIEPLITALAPFSTAHGAIDPTTLVPADATTAPEPLATDANIAAAVRAGPPRGARRYGDVVVLELPAGTDPASMPTLALRACGSVAYCKVLGWNRGVAMPNSDQIDDVARASMAFSYLRDPASGFERALWNCTLYPQADVRKCMRRN